MPRRYSRHCPHFNNWTYPLFASRSHGETYAKLMPNCRKVKIIPGAGHSVIVEKPEETAKLVADYLA